MKMFMVKSVFVAALMLISVLTGMQLAGNGIHKLKGYEDPNFQHAVSIHETNNNISASILGNDVSSHDLEAKKKKLEEISAFNFFSSMGKKMSDGISGASEKIIHLIAD
ncbi:DUF3679 domain-containing protein [Neobacillus sp. OS1-2]|uniref:DUF3679 domain-containing protein n=1 Tax=Neobacillus sp. OS1-2 TaxID=3070680 RepID=UPI0027E053C6|nr:DUF3679 domain-containing protein [Neobacillus sp. OS1-2]WML40618.1 DUF3679 domain-containing protein [Neobacillus sp. OS1-2]